jgi:hypothetical protein
VVQLHRRIDDIHRAGAELFVIGNGSPSFMDGFRETTKYDGALYTDPSLEVYKAAGLKRGMSLTFNPRSALAGARALKGGFRQGKTQGDPFQQGGTLVIAPGGTILFAHADAYAGGGAKLDDLLAILNRR